MTMVTEKQAREYLYYNTSYPTFWINELPTRKLLAIYFAEKRKQSYNQKKEVDHDGKSKSDYKMAKRNTW